MSDSMARRAVFVLVVGTAVTCLVGLVAYGAAIFNPKMAAFQLVSSGAVASALAAAVLAGRKRAVWGVAVLALLVLLSVTRPVSGARCRPHGCSASWEVFRP